MSERSPARRREDGAAVLAGLSILGGATAVARSGRVGSLEAAAFHAINGLPEGLEAPMYVIQFLGTLGVAPVLATVALARRRRRLALAIAMATVLKLASERLVRRFLAQRARPGTAIPDAVVRGDESSTGLGFVSGHVALATALAWTLTPHLNAKWRTLPWGLATLVAGSRVYLGAHSPLDVVGGAGLGVAVGGAANLLTGAADPRKAWGPDASFVGSTAGSTNYRPSVREA